MIAIDTNIIIRFLTRDNEAQFQKCLHLFKNEDIFISNTVILESEWVLRYAYKFSAQAINQAFVKLFGLDNIHLSDPNSIAKTLQWHQQGMDFADALHLAQSQSCQTFYSFDKKLAAKANQLSPDRVREP